jgi:hypothetical protein
LGNDVVFVTRHGERCCQEQNCAGGSRRIFHRPGA